MILGTGIDIIEIERIEKAVKRWGNHFLNHIFHKEEIEYSKRHKYPLLHFAGRFAAKEAIFKALGNSRITWKDIKVLNDKEGKPYCQLKDKKIKNKILLSISHTHNYAVASAIVTSKK